nr:MAG TPA: hypothetical protein [Caudoviricetes sp.]
MIATDFLYHLIRSYHISRFFSINYFFISRTTIYYINH